MIVGQLSEVTRQKDILPAAVVRAIEALRSVDLRGLEPGKYEIEGDQLFYLVQDATPRSLDECRAETHRKYADIQIPVSASERFGFAMPQPALPIVDDQFAERDLGFHPTPRAEAFFDLDPGNYVVFLPGELHRPCVSIADKAVFRKVVVKVHASLLGL